MKFKKKIDKDILEYGVYDYILLNIVNSMFTFDNLPDTIPREKIVPELLHGRAVFFDKGNKEYLILKGDYLGEVNDYGYSNSFLASGCVGAYELPLEDCEVINLNDYGNNEYFNIKRFSKILTEVDLSEMALIKASRNTEIIGVSDNKTMNVVKTALKQRDNGEVGLITDTDTLSKISGNDSIKSYQINNPSNIANMSYLSQYSNEMRKRFFMYFGLALNYNGKLAQQSELEVSENEAVAWVVPLMWYNNIKDWIERINKHFNLNINFGFSNVWEMAYTKYKKSIEDTNNDNMMNEKDNVSRETLYEKGEIDNNVE